MSDRRKRHRNARRDVSDREDDEKHETVDEDNPVIKMFRGFQTELDQRHDKYERIIKLSRDITIESKRTIFLLHRVNSTSDNQEILQQAEEKLTSVENTKFREVAKELENTDPFKFLRAYSPGLQEYIEALTFYVYLKDNKLLPLSDVQERLTFKKSDPSESMNIENNSPSNKQESMEHSEIEQESPNSTSTDECQIHVVLVPASEYVLGVADLTGEMMRRAINSVGSGDFDRPFQICKFLQDVEASYASLGNSNRDVYRKLHTLRQSLRKVESACYTLKVRGSEVPKHMLIDMISKPTMSLHVDDSEMLDDD